LLSRALNKRIFALLILVSLLSVVVSKGNDGYLRTDQPVVKDTTIDPKVRHIIELVVKASSSFDIDDIANLYTPNAVVMDKEPPYSWNGPTAAVQWVYAVERTVKQLKYSHFKGTLEPIKVCQQNSEMVYVVVPVTYTAQTPGDPFEERGAFAFVLRQVSGQWLIKSQAWLPERGL